jgi:hypothetical protein
MGLKAPKENKENKAPKEKQDLRDFKGLQEKPVISKIIKVLFELPVETKRLFSEVGYVEII